MGVLSRMLQTLRLGPERIVIVSNYTQTLDLIQTLCEQAAYPVLRLDGSISANKRTNIVDQFNNPHSGAFVFLLSSKAGGCGINLIGGSRWEPPLSECLFCVALTLLSLQAGAFRPGLESCQ